MVQSVPVLSMRNRTVSRMAHLSSLKRWFNASSLKIMDLAA